MVIDQRLGLTNNIIVISVSDSGRHKLLCRPMAQSLSWNFDPVIPDIQDFPDNPGIPTENPGFLETIILEFFLRTHLPGE